MVYSFFMPSKNLMGKGSLKEMSNDLKKLGFSNALVVTDPGLVKIKLVDKLTDVLDDCGIKYHIYGEVHPNPTTGNVSNGLRVLKDKGCDFVISFGGGSSHDCAKGIALVASNGGDIKDYEGIDQSAKPQLPLVSVNTTAGTASEMTRFCIITNESNHIKMAIVDKNTTPILSVNDPDLMMAMPPSLTAATGMDALTHAVEAYVSTIATPVTDACAIHAMKLISNYLRDAVSNGSDEKARDRMAYAQFLAGMAFNSASLGYVHAMAHQLGGFYDLPHGVCNAVLLPHVCEYNAKVVPDRFIDIAAAFGKDVRGRTSKECAEIAISEIKMLSRDVNIPSGLEELKVKKSDLDTLSANALKDACGFTNPKQATHEEIVAIFENAM